MPEPQDPLGKKVLDIAAPQSDNRPRMDRREFLLTGLAASILPWIAGDGAPATNSRSLHAGGVYKAVADVRFAAGSAFAAEAARLGLDVERITGDITDFWFRDLSQRWKESAVPIAGLTAHGPLFCLERLAWDHGLRVVVRQEHRLPGNRGEPLFSWVIAPVQRG